MPVLLHHLRRRRQKGITLIELMIAIAIALVIAAVVIGLAYKARQDATTRAVNTEIVRVAEALDMIVRNSSYTGVTTAMICDTGKLNDLCTTNGSGVTVIRNSAGGDITIGGMGGGGGMGAATMAIMFGPPPPPPPSSTATALMVTGIPVSSCTTLMLNLQMRFRGTAVNGQTLRGWDGTPASPADIATACAYQETENVELDFLLEQPVSNT